MISPGLAVQPARRICCTTAARSGRGRNIDLYGEAGVGGAHKGRQFSSVHNLEERAIPRSNEAERCQPPRHRTATPPHFAADCTINVRDVAAGRVPKTDPIGRCERWCPGEARKEFVKLSALHASATSVAHFRVRRTLGISCKAP